MSEILAALAPEILVALTAFAVLGMEIAGPRSRRPQSALALAGLALAAAATLTLWQRPEIWQPWSPGSEVAPPLALWRGVFWSDPLSLFFRTLAPLVALMALLFSLPPRDEGADRSGEFSCLVLLTTLGMMFVAGSGELLTFFIAFELMSVPAYVLAAWGRYQKQSAEAGLKYFLNGALASALILYGISLIYGMLGTTHFNDFLAGFDRLEGTPHALLLGILFVLAGLGFKMAAAPFHMWAPDVYQGAPSAAATFLSTGPKAAVLALLLRLFWKSLNLSSKVFLFPDVWVLAFALLALASMVIGNLAALVQTDIKRMMAYSGVGHIGYALVGVATASRAGAGDEGAAAALFYIFLYSFANLAAWGVILLYERASGSTRIQDYAGLARRSPFLALVLLLSFLSLAGAPPLAGFVGKFFLFRAAMASPQTWWLALVGVVASVVSLYYYFGVLKMAYLAAPDNPEPILVGGNFLAGFSVCLLAIVVLGLTPGMMEWSLQVATTLLSR
ncbi:MAG TPA: NADH-quinone oxidoreductase subunit N [Candidatus Nitrosotenuis sp.]|nr:NADH-quinone oxidoreductase subunit N [Candidatus Nitrosotenuis sp.]